MSSRIWIVPPCIASCCVMNCSACMHSLRFSPHSNYTLRCYAHNLTACTLWSAYCDRWPDLWHCGVRIRSLVTYLCFVLKLAPQRHHFRQRIGEKQNTQLACSISWEPCSVSNGASGTSVHRMQLRPWRFWLHRVTLFCLCIATVHAGCFFLLLLLLASGQLASRYN